MSLKRRVFITVKTYPTLSRKYDELVCTAGILDDGSWVRIFPLPFRKLAYDQWYSKYQWIEFELERNTEDVRPETYRVVNRETIRAIGDPVGTKKYWQERKDIIFQRNKIYRSVSELINLAHANELSLAVLKPQKIFGFDIEETERDWSKDKLALLQAKGRQLSLFKTQDELKKEFSVVRKLPYKFFYKFADQDGKESRLMIEDWEIGALYWRSYKRAEGDEKEAIAKVKAKYFDQFSKLDIHLFLGTTKQYHGWAKNPFVIIGVFYPPYNPQPMLPFGKNAFTV
ncbi:MAG: hypothetical protein Q3M24_10740 [Candidatus Electrothrix aestuarii]|uniref:Uncharacterized protein n=1 Tax=Candidatus Electrothrix aestuarii TaxID=3062594 RepID=A0AAU8M019_9BACT|nr:hypothetical protein [Candidatus Electrothrix aestuarii]